MKKNIYTAALIGTGRIGFTLGFDRKREQPASHTMALLKNKSIKIIAGCDTDEKALSEWKKYVGKYNRKVQTFTSSEDLYKSCKPDIIVIAVNEEFHFEEAIKAINAQPKLIILEKPVASFVQEGEEIVKAAESKKVPVLINHERRFSKDYIFAKDFLKKIGDVQSITGNLYSGLPVLNMEKEKEGGYSLLHDGTHLLDIILYFLENQDRNSDDSGIKILRNMKITNFYCKPEEKDKKIVRNLNVHFESDLCRDINFVISGRSRYFGFELDITGTTGRIQIGNGVHNFYIRELSKLYSGFYSLKKQKVRMNYRKTGYFSNMLQNGVDFLNGETELKSTLTNGMNTLVELENIKTELIRLLEE